jgi:hypothetical protein
MSRTGSGSARSSRRAQPRVGERIGTQQPIDHERLHIGVARVHDLEQQSLHRRRRIFDLQEGEQKAALHVAMELLPVARREHDGELLVPAHQPRERADREDAHGLETDRIDQELHQRGRLGHLAHVEPGQPPSKIALSSVSVSAAAIFIQRAAISGSCRPRLATPSSCRFVSRSASPQASSAIAIWAMVTSRRPRICSRTSVTIGSASRGRWT